MRSTILLPLLAATLFAADPDRDLKRATAYLTKGRQVVLKVEKAKTRGGRIKILTRARFYYERAAKIAEPYAGKDPRFEKLRSRATEGLVGALNEETKVHYRRKALALAKRRNAEALALDPKSKTGRALAELIKKAEDGLWVDDPDKPSKPEDFKSGLPLAKEKKGGKGKSLGGFR